MDCETFVGKAFYLVKQAGGEVWICGIGACYECMYVRILAPFLKCKSAAECMAEAVPNLVTILSLCKEKQLIVIPSGAGCGGATHSLLRRVPPRDSSRICIGGLVSISPREAPSDFESNEFVCFL